MMYLKRTLEGLAKQELMNRDIDGLVVGVRFVSDNGCSMIRIAFVSDIKPTPVLTGFDYIEHQDDEYYLYLPIDTIVTTN